MADGSVWHLPGHARIVPPPLLRPTPARAPGLLGLTLIGGRAVPAFCLADAPGPVWLVCETPDGPVLLNGDAVLEPAPPEAQVWRIPVLKGAQAPHLRAQGSPGLGGDQPRRPCSAEAGSPQACLGADTPAGTIALPLTRVERVLACQADAPPYVRPPGMPAGMLGHAILAGMPALVLDPAWLLQAAAAATETGILVLVRHDGGRYALPCRRVAPTRSGSDLLTARLAAPDAAPLRALAPPAGDPVPPPALPSRDLLLVQIDGQRLAVPVEEVASVIPPGRPVPMHSGATGIIAHRGEVLPVLDGSRCLNGASSLDSGIALPLLRLAGPTPVAVAVQRVEGLRRIPMADIAVLPPGDPALPPPLVTAVAVLAGVPLPVVATAALCRGMARGGR